ncbi:uncharacterized protein L969DRAFT_54545 [Mixia osmundae IAM 14324]|uniref:uncharacterized protein n=1 Tax=Mixia osmundae (strain CBS 9802 / IAM 14324 / JCM 22182 / KY 12970) TaxID=764103 RepID=UPI0004A548F5|nr:uncharacterized protein L969DRAFT_54545 [Mixia osmundae IAM 14324]KEI36709.1 hypothetical protein L969DRAFT_54545 [Mixia osmundae IAM 14324]
MPSQKRQKRGEPVRRGVRPSGNALLASTGNSARTEGLGSLSLLSDELISQIFGELDPDSWRLTQACSRAFFAWSSIEALWKVAYITRTNGLLRSWQGSWRSTYLWQYYGVPADCIAAPDLSCIYSDVLYTPVLAAAYDANSLVRSNSLQDLVPRRDVASVTKEGLGQEPFILTGAMDTWSAYKGSRSWNSLTTLAQRFPDCQLRAEAVLANLATYLTYHDHCPADESPLYLFESHFVEKMLCQDEYSVPLPFDDDLFYVLGDERPDYRWLIAGPRRSGSTWHVDPNATSAWNAVIAGAKAWILLPPHVLPPGVHVSADRSEVECPLSLAEWWINYYQQTLAEYGEHAKEPKHRGLLRQGICRPGEIFFVPSGWWHIVVNLEDSIAITQNFVSAECLPQVMHFLRHKPEQISGFKLDKTADPLNARDCDEIPADVYERFCQALAAAEPALYKDGLAGLRELERKSKSTTEPKSMLFGDKVSSISESSFSFDFAIDSEV